MNLNKYIDHTILRADAMEMDIINLCREAKQYEFASVCVNSSYVSLVKKELAGSPVKVCCVIGFPLGASALEVKLYETEYCVKNGADEIDMVINIGRMKSNDYDYVLKEISAIRNAAEKIILKVIIETCYLTDDEKIKACELSVAAGADYVKTSTGFGKSGAVISDVLLMKKSVAGKAFVKASGGIRDYADAISFINAGADRIGTSNGITIISQININNT